MTTRCIPVIVARRLRALRASSGLTQVAVGMCALGFGWNRSSVAQLETGRRSLSADEFMALPRAVRVAGTRAGIRVPEESARHLTDISPILDASLDGLTFRPTLAEQRAALVLKITPAQVQQQAVRRWGMSLDARRDELVAAGARAQDRGHVTRRLIAELAAAAPG